MKMKVVAIGCIVLSSIAPARGDAPAASVKVTDGVKFTVGGSLRARYEGRFNDDFRSDRSADQNFVLLRSRIDLGWNVNDNVDVFFRVQDSRRFGDEGVVAGATAGTTNPGTFLKEAYFNWNDIVGTGLALKLGRQTFNLADQRLLGAFEWNNTGRSFDAAKLSGQIGDFLPWWTFASVTTAAAQGDEFHNDQQFYGLVLSPKISFLSSSDFYALSLFDRRALASGGKDQNVHTFGGDITIPLGSHFDLDLQGNYQTGDTGLNDIDAWSFHSGLTWKTGGRSVKNVWAEYNAASGDEAPADRTTKTFNQLFPTNHLHYGYADHVGFANIHNVRVGAEGALGAKTGWQADFHWFRLDQAQDDFYTVAGAARGLNALSAGKNMGTELDLVFKYDPLPRVKIEAGYAHFFNGSDLDARIRAIGGTPKDADFVYLQSGITF